MRSGSCLLVLLAATSAQAQPDLASVFPLGGRPGSTVEIALEGKNLADVQSLLFSHPGLGGRQVKGPRFAVTIAPDIPEGEYDVWAVTAKGLSNPRRFAVSGWPEILEVEKNDEPTTATKVVLPVTINGSFSSGIDWDCYRFDAMAGQRATIEFRSLSLDGTARAAVTVLGPDGRELAHDGGRESEPTLDVELREAGSYVVKVIERGYQKGESHGYRLALFSGPRLVGAYPQLLTRGKTQAVRLYGHRLPGGQPSGGDFPRDLQHIDTRIDAPALGDGDGGGPTPATGALFEGFRYRHPGVPGVLRFGLAGGPVMVEGDEPHGTPATAQPLPVPCEVAGRFSRSREVDWYRITAKKGQLLWIEGVAERDGRTMDLEIAVHDAKGKPLQSFSDFAIKKGETAPFPPNTLDPMGLWKAEADGDHFLVVRDLYATTRWGVDRTYRLHVHPRREEVCVVMPPLAGGLAVVPGGSVKVPLAALRRGGHEAPIRVRAEGLPKGLEAKDLVIPAKQASAIWLITAAKDASAWSGRLTLVAETELDRKPYASRVVALAPARGPALRRADGVAAAILGKKSSK